MRGPIDISADPELRHVIEAAIRRLAPQVPFTITAIEELAPTQVSAGQSAKQLVIRITTSRPADLLGQYPPFMPEQLRGYHENYVFGYVHAWFAAQRDYDLWSAYELILDVRGDRRGDGDELLLSLHRDDAVRRGMLRADSPLAEAMRERRLPYVLVSGTILSGPSLGMIMTVDHVVRARGPVTVLDLFAGTCTLASVALEAGARHAVCVDSVLDLDKAAETLGNETMNVTLIEADAYQYVPSAPPDVVVCDPFYDFTLEVLRRVVPRYVAAGATVVVNLGRREPAGWYQRLIEQTQRLGTVYSVTEHLDERVVVFNGSSG